MRDRAQELLLPPSLRDWLPADHLAWFVLDAVEQFDLERSSRALERRCCEDVAVRVIAADQRPDHATIARFRVRRQDALADLFGDVL